MPCGAWLLVPASCFFTLLLSCISVFNSIFARRRERKETCTASFCLTYLTLAVYWMKKLYTCRLSASQILPNVRAALHASRAAVQQRLNDPRVGAQPGRLAFVKLLDDVDILVQGSAMRTSVAAAVSTDELVLTRLINSFLASGVRKLSIQMLQPCLFLEFTLATVAVFFFSCFDGTERDGNQCLLCQLPNVDAHANTLRCVDSAGEEVVDLFLTTHTPDAKPTRYREKVYTQLSKSAIFVSARM